MGKHKWKDRPKKQQSKPVITHHADRRIIAGLPAEQNPKFAKRSHKPTAR